MSDVLERAVADEHTSIRELAARAATDDWLDDHIEHEQALIHALAVHLTADEAQTLAVKLRAAEEYAPTRPHPYTPHTGVLGRLAHRLWARADSFWDDAEGRYFTGISARRPERPSGDRPGPTDS